MADADAGLFAVLLHGVALRRRRVLIALERRARALCALLRRLLAPVLTPPGLALDGPVRRTGIRPVPASPGTLFLAGDLARRGPPPAVPGTV
ncbi:hypothetical protein [Streptomyces sp. NPDC052225]|uniref:hypothetical protein n=1 Tax=Streptomyces sp. NPDC052225 TaxID=3154949 RepID=UPI00342C0E40